MTFVYLLCFIVATVGIVLLLGLTPDSIANDLKRLKSRVGSAMLSDITRGLISVIRGDDTAVYWDSLVLKFSDYQAEPQG